MGQLGALEEDTVFVFVIIDYVFFLPSLNFVSLCFEFDYVGVVDLLSGEYFVGVFDRQLY